MSIGGHSNPQSGRAVIPAAFCHRAFGHVHRQPRQDGRTGGTPLADRPLLVDCGRDHRAEREPAVDRSAELTPATSFRIRKVKPVTASCLKFKGVAVQRNQISST